jgi:hypothetical protein
MEKTEIHLKFNELGRSTSIQFYGIRYQVKFDPRTKVIISPMSNLRSIGLAIPRYLKTIA